MVCVDVAINDRDLPPSGDAPHETLKKMLDEFSIDREGKLLNCFINFVVLFNSLPFRRTR